MWNCQISWKSLLMFSRTVIVQQMTVSKVARTMAQQERERPAAEREQQWQHWQRGEELEAAGGRRHRQSRRQAGLIRGGE